MTADAAKKTKINFICVYIKELPHRRKNKWRL